jgi:putative SOS response-associated peptidase YedK
MKDGGIFGLAGLFERWLSPDGDVLDTCTIVTTDANALLRPVHDRMPVIVAPADYARWLETSDASVADLVAPFPSQRMAWYPVSTKVNNVRHDDASLIEHVALSPAPAAASTAAQAASPGPPDRDPEQESLF